MTARCQACMNCAEGSLHVVRHLVNKNNVSVVTNDITIAAELKEGDCQCGGSAGTSSTSTERYI